MFDPRFKSTPLPIHSYDPTQEVLMLPVKQVDQRQSWDEWMMAFARTARGRASCLKRRVGAVLVDRSTHAVLSVGYNGTPFGTVNCTDGGCPRCASGTLAGADYGSCLCVHAEENAIALAARHGVATNACAMYTTLRPCFWCVKLLIQAGITEVVFEQDDHYSEGGLEITYHKLLTESGLVERQLEL